MYDFDTLLQRKHTDCTKWDALKRDFGHEDLMPFWVADADFPILPEIAQAVQKRAGEGMTFGYTFAGEAYFDSVISWNMRRHGLNVKRESILAAPGVVTALSVTLLALTKENDAVLINPPVYPPFFDVVKGIGRRLVQSPLIVQNGRYGLNYEEMEQEFSKGVQAYILCSPHNPVGRVWEREELEKVVALCKKYRVTLISDEIHYDIVYPGHVHTPILNITTDAVMITAPSKTFNIAGLKSSVILIENPEHREAVEKWIDCLHLYLNLFAYTATEAAYQNGDLWVDEMVAYMEENARFTLRFLEKYMPGARAYMPESTYLMWIDLSAYGMNGEEIHRRLTKQAHVALNPGAEYGAGYDRFVRLNIAAPRAYLEEGLKRIKDVFETEHEGGEGNGTEEGQL
ncbi:MAG: pyridoxal phosphate-dependent aminotransferase [Lachnospiraceae bacterium]|nr:pyridoxal phosphate-dependent aminotransferase [Lachnospiraceae bacterium]